LERAKKGAKKSSLGVTKQGVFPIYIVEGVKSFSRTLTNASGVRVRQGSGQLNIKATTHGQGLPCFENTPTKWLVDWLTGKVG
jgi:hypothetical protein